MTNCMDVCSVEPWRGTKFCVRAAGRCVSPYPASLQSGSMFPTKHSEAGLERTGVQEPLWAHPAVYLCPCCYLYPVPGILLHPLTFCVFSLLESTPCSSCLSSSQSFLSSSPIPLWETLPCTWPSFQSGATFTDVSSLCLSLLWNGKGPVQ